MWRCACGNKSTLMRKVIDRDVELCDDCEPIAVDHPHIYLWVMQMLDRKLDDHICSYRHEYSEND